MFAELLNIILIYSIHRVRFLCVEALCFWAIAIIRMRIILDEEHIAYNIVLVMMRLALMNFGLKGFENSVTAR